MLEQIKNKWPGQVQTALQLCEELGISGLLNPDISKSQFKQIVKRSCQKQNDEELRDQIESYKKMSALRDEVRKGNAYFFNESLQDVRSIFRFRVDLIEAKKNYKNKYRNQSELCDSCESAICETSHILYCPAYSALRENKSLNCDKDLATYLQKVLKIRTNLNLNI